MAEEDEGCARKKPKEIKTLTSSLLCTLPLKMGQTPDQNAGDDAIPDQNALWIAVHGSKSAILVQGQKTVHLVDVSDTDADQKTMLMPEKVAAMAFSACGEFIALADAAGTLSLYKIDGRLLFGHRVVRAGGSDSVVSIEFATSDKSVGSSDAQDLVVLTSSGVLLRLGDLRLAEFEQLLLDKPKGALSVIIRNIRFGRASVGRLKSNARSCVVVHHFEEEECTILGNHGAFLSAWKTSLLNQAERSGIEKLSVCDSKSEYVEAMTFDTNSKLLVVLSGGKLSWWNWREMTASFEVDISGIMSFAVLNPSLNEEPELEVSSLLAVARLPEDRSPTLSLELVQVLHPEPGQIASTYVVSRLPSSENVWTQSEGLHVALFASPGGNNKSQTLAAYRTRRGVSVLLVASDDDTFTSDASDNDDKEITFDEDAVTIAESLVNAPISSLLHKRALKSFQTKIDMCTGSIGEEDDNSRVILKHLLNVAGAIREYTTSSSRRSSIPAKVLQWCDEISEVSYKWTTFQLLCTSSSNEAGASGKTLREKWHLFRRMSVVEMLENYMKIGSMRAVMILWGRHLDEDTVCNIGRLLRCLPASLPVSAYAGWIQNEVMPTLIQRVVKPQASELDPTVNHASRSVLAELAHWLLERSEAAAAKTDLDTAIRICNLIKCEDDSARIGGDNFSLYEFKLQTLATHAKLAEVDDCCKETATEPDAFERIEIFCQKLRHVKRLAVDNHFIISLSVFNGETPATIAMSMLDRVSAPDLLTKEVRDHVRKYLKFCDVDVDPVLCDYVTELAESIQASHSGEEARALVLLDEITDANIRADATLALLRSALPPYSPALKSYAHNCALSWKSYRLEAIQEHVRLMEIQDMLTAYDIKRFDIADTKSASRMVSHILNQVSRPTAFTDAMLLVDAYSDLHCDRAVVKFTENLLADSSEDFSEVDARVSKAIGALSAVKKRRDPKPNAMLTVSLMEEIIEFGVMLLEMEAEELDLSRRTDKTELQSEDKPLCFVLRMLEALVAAYLPEFKTTMELAFATKDDTLTSYVSSPVFLLSDKLLVDLQTIRRVEADYGILLSVSALRDSEKCESKLKELMRPEMLFADDCENTGDEGTSVTAATVTFVGKGNGKKRAVASSEHNSSFPTKRQRTSTSFDPQSCAYRGQQQDDNRTRLIFDLNRFASAVGIESKACQSLIAQSAAQNGFILQAVRFSRDLFSRKSSTGIDDCAVGLPLKVSGELDPTTIFHRADMLKKIAISMSLYLSTHVKSIYDVHFTRNQQPLPAHVARIETPMYTLELLKYSLCMCDEDSFDETLILLKNTTLVNEVLQSTQHDIMTAMPGVGHWTLYPRWYQGDSFVLPRYEAMKLATRFAIAEHKNLRLEVEARDTIASKRYVSFLVEQRADLLGLQALLSMQELPDDAAAVVNAQMDKLLSTVFQSQEIDNYLALGLMLSMEQKSAFDAFRRQMSRENVAKDFNRFQQLAFVGADAARAWQQIAFLHQCVDLEGNARWWHYLDLLGIECDHKAFQSERRDLEYIRCLVPTLITRSNFDFYTVLEFTRHYQIDDNFPSLVYAESLLLEDSATADLEYQDKIAGVVEDIHEQHLVKMLLKSIPKISGQDYERLLFIFRLLLEHTSTSYRRREEVERRVEVLRNLKVFAAFQGNDYLKTVDKQAQQDGNCSSNESERGNKANVEKISFHDVITEPRKVLARVVTKDNLSALIGLAQPLQLEPDELQMMLLKNMVAKNLNRKSLKDEDSSGSIQFSFFEGILGCLSDTECRVTAAEWLAENFPLCEEKLKSLDFALNAAVSGGNGGENPFNTSFTGHEALTRLETKILRVKLELLLRNASSQTSSFAEVINGTKQTNQLIALVSEPKKIFVELYRRYALWFYTHSSDTLNTVASSIAELLHLPQTKLRLELVREWLVKEAVQVGKHTANEEGKEDPFELLEEEKLQRSDEDFGKRILYMASSSVKHGDLFSEEVLSYLVGFVKDSLPRAGVTFRAKMRALRVVLRLGQLYPGAVKQYAIAKYGIDNSDAFFKELLEYTKHCTHMMAFEERRVPYEMPFVVKTDKEALTRSFLRRYSSYQPWVLRCASQLMLDFEIEASDLWEDVLSNMVKVGMIRSLTNILGPLSRKSFVRSLNCGRQVWEEVLTSPMIQLKHTHSKFAMVIRDNDDANLSANPTDGEILFAGVAVSNIRSALAQIVSLLQKCPFLDQIDVPAIVIHLRDLTEMAEGEANGAEVVSQLDLYGFAVKCAMVIPKPVARFEALVRIIRAGAFGSVLHELLDTSCFLDGDQNEMIIEGDSGDLADNFRLIQESFSEAAKRKDYSSILATPFEPGFVEYMAATADIDYLLSLLLDDKRMETALNVVELFYEYHPIASPSLDSTKTGNEDPMVSPDSKRWELIDVYLASSKSAQLERFKVPKQIY